MEYIMHMYIIGTLVVVITADEKVCCTASKRVKQRRHCLCGDDGGTGRSLRAYGVVENAAAISVESIGAIVWSKVRLVIARSRVDDFGVNDLDRNATTFTSASLGISARRHAVPLVYPIG